MSVPAEIKYSLVLKKPLRNGDFSTGLQMSHGVYTIAIPVLQKEVAALRKSAVDLQNTNEADAAKKKADAAKKAGHAARKEADAARKEADGFAVLSFPRVPSYYLTHGFEQGSGGKTDRWWEENEESFPVEDRKEAPIYRRERIPPLPAIMPQNLIDEFWTDNAKDAAKIHPDNKDSLLRPYLGAIYDRMTTEGRVNADKRLASLANFPLYLDEMRALDAESPIRYAENMALGLAAAHYAALIHTQDVEFAIARRTNALDPDDPKNFDFGFRATQLWMLDYDKAGDFSIKRESETEDMQKLVKKCMDGTDPYYPRCDVLDREDFEVFAAFSNTYIKAGRAIMKHKLHADWAEIMGEDNVNKGLNRPKQFMREWYNLQMSKHDEGMKRLLEKKFQEWKGMLRH
ncbi:hypothetical protein CPLU01_14579 [Colletotrichum plurivorum]|uniref:DUF3669 domain-containing protein n=1 Tax=Colletotrichum plurivorum TaxID=2175906 RepID=A0A8H6MYJ7_9PEZI|nr:hypothetical protein CPLU01_14579 [Colletotrichum plurivorum]